MFWQIFQDRRRPTRKDAGGCWEEKPQDVSVRGTVGSGHRAHVRAVRAAAVGAHPPAVEPPLEPDAGQGEQSAAAEGLHGLAAGGRDLPLAVPGEFSCFLLIAWLRSEIYLGFIALQGGFQSCVFLSQNRLLCGLRVVLILHSVSYEQI